MDDNKPDNKHYVPSFEEMREYFITILHNIGGTEKNVDELASENLKEAQINFDKALENIIAHIRKK